MAQFNIDQFLEQPSLEQLACCRKDDLAKIASCFSISYSKQLVKKELRDLIVNKLVELNLLTLPSEISVSSALPTDAVPAAESESAGPSNIAKKPQELTPEVDMEVVGGIATPVTLPRFDPLSVSPGSVGSKVDARLKVRLARLQFEAEEKAQLRQYQLEVKRLEIEAEKAIKLRRLELEYQARSTVQTTSESPGSSFGGPFSVRSFDVTKNVALVPEFRETEIDSYFSAFERIAQALQWPPDVWSILLQCKIHGKAQKVVAALPLHDTLKYEVVKAAILKAYELVPEAYRQKFRSFKKNPTQTYVEFAREKGSLFDRWCASSEVTNLSSLREMVLLEEFKNCLPECVVVHLNEQKVNSLSSAAVLVDEYVLTHKSTFQSVFIESVPAETITEQSRSPPQKDDRECFYCHKTGHLIANCLALKRKEQNTLQTKPNGVGLIKNKTYSLGKAQLDCTPDPCFEPFLLDGSVSLSGKPADQHPVRILRDTGASQSVILVDSLPFSELSSCGYNVALQGVEMGCVPRPVHLVHLQSKLISGTFPVAICSALPIKGISFLLGNDIAGGKVIPALEVLDVPCSLSKEEEPTPPNATTSQKMQVNSQVPAANQVKPDVLQTAVGPSSSVTQSQFCATQKVDPAVKRCFSSGVSADKARVEPVSFYALYCHNYGTSQITGKPDKVIPPVLRHTIYCQSQQRPNPEMYKACDWEVKRKAFHHFLGIDCAYRNLCRTFLIIVLLFTTLLNLKVTLNWTPECQHSVRSLLSHPPILSSPDMSKAFKLEVEDVLGPGAMLQEGDNGADHPVCYFLVNLLRISSGTLSLRNTGFASSTSAH